MDEDRIVIEFSTASLIIGWVCVKLAAAAYLQRCYALMLRLDEAISGKFELKKLSVHFIRSFLMYPEALILWACCWPMFALVTWRWDPKHLLPGTVIDYLEFRNGR
jgi:hypothetical protein